MQTTQQKENTSDKWSIQFFFVCLFVKCRRPTQSFVLDRNCESVHMDIDRGAVCIYHSLSSLKLIFYKKALRQNVPRYDRKADLLQRG